MAWHRPVCPRRNGAPTVPCGSLGATIASIVRVALPRVSRFHNHAHLCCSDFFIRAAGGERYGEDARMSERVRRALLDCFCRRPVPEVNSHVGTGAAQTIPESHWLPWLDAAHWMMVDPSGDHIPSAFSVIHAHLCVVPGLCSVRGTDDEFFAVQPRDGEWDLYCRFVDTSAVVQTPLIAGNRLARPSLAAAAVKQHGLSGLRKMVAASDGNQVVRIRTKIRFDNRGKCADRRFVDTQAESEDAGSCVCERLPSQVMPVFPKQVTCVDLGAGHCRSRAMDSVFMW